MKYPVDDAFAEVAKHGQGAKPWELTGDCQRCNAERDHRSLFLYGLPLHHELCHAHERAVKAGLMPEPDCWWYFERIDS